MVTAELMASHNSLDPAARSSTAPPVDTRFPPGATATRQQQVLVDQLQQQQQQQRLLSSLGGILSSNLPINANQLQVMFTFTACSCGGQFAEEVNDSIRLSARNDSIKCS